MHIKYLHAHTHHQVTSGFTPQLFFQDSLKSLICKNQKKKKIPCLPHKKKIATKTI